MNLFSKKHTALLFLLSTATQIWGGGVCHDQKHMAQALSGMRAARGELDHAEHNKGGWRDSAIKNIDQAIKDTDKGCEFAD